MEEYTWDDFELTLKAAAIAVVCMMFIFILLLYSVRRGEIVTERSTYPQEGKLVS